MDAMISFCGLACDECPAFIATQKDDREAIEKIAAEWAKQFGIDVPAESVFCDGCKSDTGRLCGYCTSCGVRECGVKRGVVTCASCDDYGCEILLACPAYEARGKETLERLRSQ